MATKKDIQYYVNLPWTYTVETAITKGKKYYIVRVNELPGVCTDAQTVDQALEDILEPLTGTIELYLEQGDEIPEPISREKYKGNISYRTTRERHYHLAKLAEEKHISMNKALDMVFDVGISSISTRYHKGN